jgi:hypothetical protein
MKQRSICPRDNFLLAGRQERGIRGISSQRIVDGESIDDSKGDSFTIESDTSCANNRERGVGLVTDTASLPNTCGLEAGPRPASGDISSLANAVTVGTKVNNSFIRLNLIKRSRV